MRQKGTVALLVFLLTIGLGIIFLIESLRTPDTNSIEKMLFLILAAALLPAGILWAIEHYFLIIPIKDEYESMRQKLEARIDDMETYDAIRKHGLRSISTQRADLVKKVLNASLDDETIKEIIIVGSTQDGLIRRAKWFEEFGVKA